jgi:hypothetical protein
MYWYWGFYLWFLGRDYFFIPDPLSIWFGASSPNLLIGGYFTIYLHLLFIGMQCWNPTLWNISFGVWCSTSWNLSFVIGIPVDFIGCFCILAIHVSFLFSQILCFYQFVEEWGVIGYDSRT